MSVIKIVKDDDYKILRNYLNVRTGEVVVLIPEKIAKETGALHLNNADPDLDSSYNNDIFDVYLEVANSKGHGIFGWLKEKGLIK